MFFPRKRFLMWGGGVVGPGCARAPNDPPPPGGGGREALSNGRPGPLLRGRTVRCARAVRKVGCSPPPGVR